MRNHDDARSSARACASGLSMAAPRTAIVSVWDGNPQGRYACSVLLWCRSASLLQQHINASDIVIISGAKNMTKNKAAKIDCPNATFYFPASTYSAAVPYFRRITQEVREHGISVNVLLKLAVFSMTSYDLILFADLDIDLWASDRMQDHNRMFDIGAYRRSIDAFLASGFVIAMQPDFSAPANTGAFIAKPHAGLHANALRFLRNATFTRCCGFHHGVESGVGGGPPNSFKVDTQSLALGFSSETTAYCKGASGGFKARETHSCVLKKLGDTHAYHRKSWQFTGATLDQGIFWWLFYVKHHMGTWADGTTYKRWGVLHYWGYSKPWREAGTVHNRGASVNYLRAMREDEAATGTPCATELTRIREGLRSKNKFDNIKGWGAVTGWMTPLPSPRVASFSLTREQQQLMTSYGMH